MYSKRKLRNVKIAFFFSDSEVDMKIFIASERKEDLVENKPVFAVKNK